MVGRPHVADVGASSALASSEVNSSSSSVTDSFAVTVNLFRESERGIYAGISVELEFMGNCWPQISLIAKLLLTVLVSRELALVDVAAWAHDSPLEWAHEPVPGLVWVFEAQGHGPVRGADC